MRSLRKSILAGLALGVVACAAIADDPADDSDPIGRCPGFEQWQDATRLRARAGDAALNIHRGTPTLPALRRELLHLMKGDQDIRNRMLPGAGGHRPTERDYRQMAVIDRDNLRRFKKIFRRLGMPTITQVGQDGAEAAFLLVQHAPDAAFQRLALQSMQQRVEQHEASPPSYALLLDRVRVGQGQAQRYGSQFKEVDGTLVLEAVEDQATLDQRRDAMFLPPMRVYACVLHTLQGLPVVLSALDAAP